MKKTKYSRIIFNASATLWLASNSISCTNEKEKIDADETAVVLTAKAERIKNISELEIELQDAPGRELCKTYCLTCHSLQYIEMQPDFPEETWYKIVDKMVKTFGAPIPDSTVSQIVDYLVHIKGKKN